MRLGGFNTDIALMRCMGGFNTDIALMRCMGGFIFDCLQRLLGSYVRDS